MNAEGWLSSIVVLAPDTNDDGPSYTTPGSVSQVRVCKGGNNTLERVHDPMAISTPPHPQLTPAQERTVAQMCEREDLAHSVASGFPGILGGILAQDAGFGKTRVVCAMIARVHENQNAAASAGPTLIVVPRMVLSEWPAAVLQETGTFPIVVTSKKFFDSYSHNYLQKNKKVVITTYGILRECMDSARHHFSGIEWGRIVVDEAHVLRNPKTVLYRALKSLRSVSRWAVTATPVHNTQNDMLQLAKFVGVHATDVRTLRDAQIIIRNNAHTDHQADATEQLGKQLTDLSLLHTNISIIRVELDESSRDVYDKVRTCFATAVRSGKGDDPFTAAIGGAPDCTRHALMTVLRLRQAATHPALVSMNDTAVVVQRARTVSAKFDAVRSECRRLTESKSSCVIFCNWIAEMDLLESFLASEFPSVPLDRLDGRSSLEAREELFAMREEGPRILLCQIDCASCGVNMQYVYNSVLVMRPQWNPIVEYQAIKRVLRRGQRRSVSVVRLVASGTVDDQVLQRQRDKAENISAVMQDDVVAMTLRLKEVSW